MMRESHFYSDLTLIHFSAQYEWIIAASAISEAASSHHILILSVGRLQMYFWGKTSLLHEGITNTFLFSCQTITVSHIGSSENPCWCLTSAIEHIFTLLSVSLGWINEYYLYSVRKHLVISHSGKRRRTPLSDLLCIGSRLDLQYN